MNEGGPTKKSISLEELEMMKKRWLVLNASFDSKFFDLLTDPARLLSKEEFNAFKADQQELADIENRVLDSARQ